MYHLPKSVIPEQNAQIDIVFTRVHRTESSAGYEVRSAHQACEKQHHRNRAGGLPRQLGALAKDGRADYQNAGGRHEAALHDGAPLGIGLNGHV